MIRLTHNRDSFNPGPYRHYLYSKNGYVHCGECERTERVERKQPATPEYQHQKFVHSRKCWIRFKRFSYLGKYRYGIRFKVQSDHPWQHWKLTS